jgi:hypothetical protein
MAFVGREHKYLMPITSADLLFKYSIQTGPGNTNDQADPSSSIGGFISDTAWAGGLESLFDDLTPTQNAAGQVDYRCIFLHNAHQSLTLIRPVAWIVNPVVATIAIGVDPAPTSLVDSSAAQATSPADRYTVPVGVAFIPAADRKHALYLGNIPAGMCRAIWIRRTAPGFPVSPAANAKFVLRVAGDTLT